MQRRTAGRTGTPRWGFRYVAGGVVVLLAAYTYWALWFVDRAPVFDELGLFNAAYMFDRTGAVTYPIYPAGGSTTAMFVHPPTHYFILGLLMRVVHLAPEAAALVPVIVWTVVAVAAGMFCPFSRPARFAIAAGVIAGIVMWAPPFYIRPDVDMAVTWIAGLVVLEGGRLSGWNPVILAVGAFLLTLASALHYPMTPAFLGLVVYAVWMVRDLGVRGSARPMAALVGGALIPGIPYLALFVIPHYSEIRSFAGGANGGFHPIRAFDGEIAAYKSMVQLGQGGTLLSAVAAPFTHSRIPVGAVAVPFLFWRRDTRGIALACLPALLFVLFFDTENHQLYDTGEFTLYFMAVAYAAVLAITAVARRVRRAEDRVAMIAAVSVLLFVLVFGRPAIDAFGKRTSHPTHREMDIARAAGRAGIGVDGLVASFDASTTWYTAGGSEYYPLWRDISYATDVQHLNLRAYLNMLPSLAESNTGTAISYWAAQRLLTARGFYFDWPLTGAGAAQGPPGQGWAGSSRIRYILYSSVPEPVAGVAQGPDNSVLVFTTHPGGSWEFVSAFCQATSASIGDIGPWSLTVDVPQSLRVNGISSTEPHTLLSVVAHPQTIAQAAVLRAHRCRILRQAGLSARTERVQQLLATAQTMGANRTIAFPGWVPAVDALMGPGGRPTPVNYNAPPLWAAAGPGARVKISADGVAVTTAAGLYSKGATIPLTLPQGQSHLWFGMHVHVTQGTVDMCVIDLVSNQCAYPPRQLLAPGSGHVYLQVPNTPDKLAVYIENVGVGPAELAISGRGDVVRTAPR